LDIDGHIDANGPAAGGTGSLALPSLFSSSAKGSAFGLATAPGAAVVIGIPNDSSSFLMEDHTGLVGLIVGVT